eukprot:TRINITY_DN7766_c0_g2_i2.p1 TRINITY_DN7766_c0_g2~~TRINITY_DN7766_c0_g2_i2.p1  ORF type:complete len:236 (-),score=46.83 TRINITY_DN7766_c0_g2_i2:154-861(-)
MCIRDRVITTYGSLFHIKGDRAKTIHYIGMNQKTVDSFMVLAWNDGKLGDPAGQYTCAARSWQKGNLKQMEGEISITNINSVQEIRGSCESLDGKDEVWAFDSRNIASKSLFFSLEEAAMRTEILLDQGVEKFSSPNVIFYSILDYPYLKLECNEFLDPKYPTVNNREPGVIIVGKDGKNCGIVDHLGTGFIHTCSAAKKVTREPMEDIAKHFTKGVVYKKYPQTLSAEFFLQNN